MSFKRANMDSNLEERIEYQDTQFPVGLTQQPMNRDTFNPAYANIDKAIAANSMNFLFSFKGTPQTNL